MGDVSKECFVIMPITVPALHKDRYGGREDHFEQIRDQLVFPAIERAGYQPKSPVRVGSENIHAAIINDLKDAPMVLADLSSLNANVFLELGIRTALDKPVCLVWDGLDHLPFDTGSINSHQYSPTPMYELNVEIAKLAQHLSDTATTSSDGRNPLWKYFGTAVDGDLPVATVNPDDASLEAKVDRLTNLVERTIALRPPESDRRIEMAREAYSLQLEIDNLVSEMSQGRIEVAKLSSSRPPDGRGPTAFRAILTPANGVDWEDAEHAVHDIENVARHRYPTLDPIPFS